MRRGVRASKVRMLSGTENKQALNTFYDLKLVLILGKYL